jgi:hypothetical protein
MVLAVLPSPTKTHQSPLVEGFALFEQANVAYIQFARWLKDQQESMKPKAFKELLKGYGMVRREATKFIKLAGVSSSFVPSDLAKLGTMMFSLLTPRYGQLWDEMQDETELTQDLVEGLKKQMFPTKKREKNEPSIWRQPPGGGTRYCQIPPIHDQDTGVKLERIVLEEGITPQKVVTEALECYEALKDGKLMWVQDAGEAQAAFSDLAASSNLAGGNKSELALGTEIAADIDLVASSDLASDEGALAVEETSPSQLEGKLATSSFEVASFPIPTPSERWKEGWKKGDVVATNSLIPTLPRWVTGEPLQIVDVIGSVGSVQRITVINSSNRQYSTYGNWVEVAPLYQVNGSDKEWSGKIVKIDSIGRVYHRVSAVDDESCWTSMKHEFLVPVVDEGYNNSHVVSTPEQKQSIAVTPIEALELEQDELEQFISSEEVAFQEWGLSLGDTVVWCDDERSSMMAGSIYDVTSDVALVDCSGEEPVAVAYANLRKITLDSVELALSDGKSSHSQIYLKARSVKALWNINSIQAEACLKELLKMTWHYKVWIDEQAMSESNCLVFIPGGRDYLDESDVVESNTSEIPINPVEEIAKAFRNATDWAQIRIALLTYGYEHKQAAWNLLFDAERKRFLLLMPDAIKTLSSLKKDGRILDFKEDATGENFFIKLKSGIEQEVSRASLDKFVLELEPF